MKLKKLFAVAIALLTFMAFSMAASAATAETVQVEPGQNATLTFTIADVYGVDGEFTYSGSAVINGVPTYGGSGSMKGDVTNNLAYFFGTEKTTQTITVLVPVSASAKEGDQIIVNFHYETSNEKGEMSPWADLTSYINVVAPSGGEGSGDEGGGNEGGGNEGSGDQGGSTTVTPIPVTPNPATPTKPKEPVVAIDYTELKKQISIAEALVEGDYTKESWADLAKALADAKAALKSKDQSVVDDAADALAQAIKKLVPADYSKLKAAIKDGEALAEGDTLGNLWFKLFNAMEQGNDLIGSGDQAAVDKATEKILALIEELKKAIEEQTSKTEVVTVTKEVKVEVEPEGDYCNIKIHKIWPILFFVSLGVNVLMGSVIVALVTRKKKNRKDNTPLVDYEIGDDE